MRQPKHSHEWWMRYIEDWKTTDKSISEYCKEHNLSTTSFYWHLKVDKDKSMPIVCEIVPIEIPMACTSTMKINGISIEADMDIIKQILGIRQ